MLVCQAIIVKLYCKSDISHVWKKVSKGEKEVSYLSVKK